jgi:hypothetical protein
MNDFFMNDVPMHGLMFFFIKKRAFHFTRLCACMSIR